MTSHLEPHLLTVHDIFGDARTSYTVPIYQRNYAWKAEQIEQLIEDVRDALAQGDDEYFLGNLVVTRSGQPRSSRILDHVDFEVIDGQQRLTTLHLLMTYLSPMGAHQDRLRYQSRPRSAAALRRIAAESARTNPHGLLSADDDDPAVHEGYNTIQQYMQQHFDEGSVQEFSAYLQHAVTLVRAALPAGTDLNRYFEVMNTRGEQLQQVDIVKARLLSRLGSDSERSCFAWVWDACADMDSYVQMSLTRGDTRLRGELFGDDWSWLEPRTFGDLLSIADGRGQSSRDTATSSIGSRTLEDAINSYAHVASDAAEDDPDNVRFRSTIEFATFLLHILKLVGGEVGDNEVQLDDKRLIDRFDKMGGTSGGIDPRTFIYDLLRYRNLFDHFVVKRQLNATVDDERDWSLQRLVRRRTSGRSRPGYVNTFSQGAPTTEEDGPLDATTREVLTLQSMLRVTYTSPRTMHWITELLRVVSQGDPRAINGETLMTTTLQYARAKVSQAFLSTPSEPTGFEIGRIVFTYLDYLVLQQRPDPGFRFAFRNSIEHFFPQHPDEEQRGSSVVLDLRDLLGNLALVNVSTNSKFSNSLPEVKARYDRLTMQSPKLQLMAEITEREGWGNAQVRRHHQEMVGLLLNDLRRGEG